MFSRGVEDTGFRLVGSMLEAGAERQVYAATMRFQHVYASRAKVVRRGEMCFRAAATNVSLRSTIASIIYYSTEEYKVRRPPTNAISYESGHIRIVMTRLRMRSLKFDNHEDNEY